MFYVDIDPVYFSYRNMPPRRNPRRERTGDRHSAEASHTPSAERGRDASALSPSRLQDIPNPSPLTRERRYEKLRKLGASSFSGTLDPAEAEAWLESTERIFNLMQCTPEERFDYAVFLFQGDAYNWWKMVPYSMIQPPILTWEDFFREYREKYTPPVYKREKHWEFIELK